MKTTRLLWAPLVFVLLAGCGTTIETQKGGPPTLVHGMPYFLPIGVITIKGEYAKTGSASARDPGLSMGLISKEPDSTGGSTANNVTLSVGGWTVTISGDVEADASQPPCYAIPHRNYFFDDDYKLAVNNKHLLSAGNSTSEDRTASIIGAVGEIAATFARAAGTPSPVSPNRKPFLVSFRTNSPGEYEKAQTVLSARNFRLAMDPRPSTPVPVVPVDGREGIIFRLAQIYRVSINYDESVANGDITLSHQHNFLLPGLQTYVFDYHRIPFVKRVNDVTFTDGMLAEYRESVPSPILGVLAIPKAIIGAIVPLVGGGSLGGSTTAPATSATPAAAGAPPAP